MSSLLKLISKSINIKSFIENVKITYTHNKNYTDITGKLGEDLCKYYFLFNSRSYNVKNYYTRSSLPDNLLNKLKLDRKDRGTDAFIHHNNDKFSFIQCKFRSNITETLDRSSVSNMFSECYGSQQELIQNCYLFSTVLKEPLELSESEKSKISFILYNELDSLNWTKFKEFVVQLLNVDNKHDEVKFNQLPSLYEHQKLVLELSNDTDKMTLISACGTGKELIGFLILMKELNKSNNNIGLLLVPSLYLMSQAYRNYCLYSDIPKLLVGSDYNDEKDDEIAKLYDNNYKFPYKLTTDEKEIYQFLIDNNNSIIISTYQSCRKVYNVLKQHNFNISLSICDEAHLTSTQKKDSNFNLILKDDFPTQKRIFMTATTKIYKGKNDECYSMDNEKLYGKIHNIMSFRQAIDKQILCDYKLMLGIGKSIENLKVSGLKDDEGNELDVSSRECILLNMIKKDLQEEYSRIIICSNNHKNSKHFYHFCKLMLKDTNVKLVLMKSNSNAKDKDKATRLLKSENKCIIFQVRIFNLGVNINEITTIGLLDDKNSTIDIVQTIARAFRKHPSKDDIGARILIPVVINERKESEIVEGKDGEFEINVNKEENFFDGNEFNNVKNILTSISLYDEAIKEEILIKMRGCRTRNNENQEEKKYTQRIIIDYMIDIKEIENIKLEMFDKFGQKSMFSWENNLKIVLEYKEKNDGKLPKTNDKFNKGAWFSEQIKEYKRGELGKERKELIDKFELIDKNQWNTQKEQKGKNTKENLEKLWNDQLDIVLKYKKENKKNPIGTDKENKGSWLRDQLKLYRRGKMPKERKKEFDKYNFIKKEEWNTLKEEKGKNSKENRDKQWQEKLNIVLKYKKNNKNKDPTSSNIKQCGNWLQNQRTQYRQGKLSVYRKKEFDKYKLIDPKEWNTKKEQKGKNNEESRDKQWNENLNIVLKYKEQNNKNNPHQKDKKNKGQWLNDQLKLYRKGKLSDERKKEFDKYKFINKNQWNINNKIDEEKDE